MESLHIKLGIGFQVNRYVTCEKGVTLTSLLFNVMTNFLTTKEAQTIRRVGLQDSGSSYLAEKRK
jgi:hypothetical protein